MKKGQRASKTARKIFLIAKFIELHPDTYLQEIARNLKMHPYTVHRCLKEIHEFLMTKSYSEQLGMNFNLPILIRLKEGITAEGIVRYLKVKDKIKSI